MSSAGGSAEMATISAQFLTDDQLSRLSKEELMARLRARESECMRLMRDRAQLMKDVNRTLQLHLAEVRGLREVNQALQKDNQELRDLGCFLDDDRLKARKIAKEWQKFGKYTSTVMRQEVTAYQMKLYELEQKQDNLLKENIELKELCLYLDDDREQRHEQGRSRQPRASAIPMPNDISIHRSVSEGSSTLEKINHHHHSASSDFESKIDQITCRQTNLSLASKSDIAKWPNSSMTRNDLNSNNSIGDGHSVYNPDESIGYVGEADGIDVDVSHASNHSSTSSFSSNLDSNSSNVEVRLAKK